MGAGTIAKAFKPRHITAAPLVGVSLEGLTADMGRRVTKGLITGICNAHPSNAEILLQEVADENGQVFVDCFGDSVKPLIQRAKNAKEERDELEVQMTEVLDFLKGQQEGEYAQLDFDLGDAGNREHKAGAVGKTTELKDELLGVMSALGLSVLLTDDMDTLTDNLSSVVALLQSGIYTTESILAQRHMQEAIPGVDLQIFGSRLAVTKSQDDTVNKLARTAYAHMRRLEKQEEVQLPVEPQDHKLLVFNEDVAKHLNRDTVVEYLAKFIDSEGDPVYQVQWGTEEVPSGFSISKTNTVEVIDMAQLEKGTKLPTDRLYLPIDSDKLTVAKDKLDFFSSELGIASLGVEFLELNGEVKSLSLEFKRIYEILLADVDVITDTELQLLVSNPVAVLSNTTLRQLLLKPIKWSAIEELEFTKYKKLIDAAA